MWVLPRAGSPTVTTRIFPAWNKSPDVVVYSGATIGADDKEEGVYCPNPTPGALLPNTALFYQTVHYGSEIQYGSPNEQEYTRQASTMYSELAWPEINKFSNACKWHIPQTIQRARTE